MCCNRRCCHVPRLSWHLPPLLQHRLISSMDIPPPHPTACAVAAAMTAWLQTVDKADVIGFVPLPENATDEEALAYATEQFGSLMQSGAFPATSVEAEPPGRRLLYAAGLSQSEGATIELAYALGIITSFGSSLMTGGLTGIQIVGGAAYTAWKTVGNTLGLATGNLLSMETQSSLNDDMATLFTAVTDDVTVEQAFLSGQVGTTTTWR